MKAHPHVLITMVLAVLLHADPAAAQTADSVDTGSSFFLSVINDNYTGTPERGEKGWYLGPDDFLTVSFFLKVHWQDWHSAIIYNNLTSRKFEYRYDLIYAGGGKSFRWKEMDLQPTLGLVWKGNCGGDDLQNWFHRGKDIPELFIPYLDPDLGVYVSLLTRWDLQLAKGSLSPALELRLLSGIAPSRLSPMVGYQAGIWQDRLQIKVLGGARLYLNEVSNYSEFVRFGPFGGVNVRFRIYRKFHFDYGMTFFPARNLENEPTYKDRDHPVLPQLTMVFSWNPGNVRLFDHLNY